MVVWPFIPQVGITESLEWLTDVIRCKAGESRVSLRLGPRHGYQFNSQLSSQEYARAKTLSRTIEGEFEIPMWPHLVNVGDVAFGQSLISGSFNSAIFTDRVILWESSQKWEVLTVVSADIGLEFSTPASENYYNALVAPLQQTLLAQSVDFKIANGDMWISDIRTVSVAAAQLEPVGSLPQHRGYDVLTDPNILLSSLTERHHRETTDIDNRTGVMVHVPLYAAPESKSRMSWKPVNSDELYLLLPWIHSRRGRKNPFWYISHNRDLSPQSDLELYVPGKDQVEISTVVGLTLPLDITILQVSTGQRLYYQVYAIVELGDKQRLIFETTETVTWGMGDLDISFLVPVRFDADRIELKHMAGGATTISVPITEVPGI